MSAFTARGRFLATTAGLREQGFTGFIRIADLDLQDIPQQPGIYAVVWDGPGLPPIAERSVGGWFKGKDPSVPRSEAASRLLPGVELVYLGKASAGTTASRGLRKRVSEFIQFGQGKPVGHWGGRYVWQIQNPGQLRIAWKAIEDADPRDEEKAHLESFKEEFGHLPYANLRG